MTIIIICVSIFILFPFTMVCILTGSTTRLKVLTRNNRNTSNSDGILHISIINCITFLIYNQYVFPTVQRIEIYMYITKFSNLILFSRNFQYSMGDTTNSWCPLYSTGMHGALHLCTRHCHSYMVITLYLITKNIPVVYCLYACIYFYWKKKCNLILEN